MLQENIHGRNAVPASRVIRIDQEVWAELQRRAVPFKDNPNSVLRKILGLSPSAAKESDNSHTDYFDHRAARLLRLVETRVGISLAASPIKNGQAYRLTSQRGKVVVFIHRQKRRLKIESGQEIAAAAGINTWDHWLNNGWWGQDNSVYWHIPDDDDDAYVRAAGLLERLWRI